MVGLVRGPLRRHLADGPRPPAALDAPAGAAYDHRTVEAKWQRSWRSAAAQPGGQSVPAAGASARDKFYVLSMFPYPSGALHMGHARVYTISDCLARFQRMQGFDVLHPMGWDAFGLPAENAAIERGLCPARWTRDNIAHMREQLHALGVSFDWSCEVATCDKAYYRWTQWLFIQLFRAGLAYRAHAEVNWDPVDQTVLANEQVDELGRSWRSGAVVEKRWLEQWFFRITHYAEALLAGLDALRWPEMVKTMQRNWIGRTCDPASGRATYRLRDWLISRQRYWGTPIPMVHCAHCGPVPVPEDQLPVELPEGVQLAGRGGSPLAGLTEWTACRCPACDRPARRETDTMDTFVDSSWYYLRFIDPHNAQRIVDDERSARYMPVDLYVGGIEHAILHLLYARFIAHFLADRGVIAPTAREPFQTLLTQGMVQGKTYRSSVTGAYLRPHEIDETAGGAGVCVERSTGQPAVVTFEKMSKSKYNGVDPQAILDEHGADVCRLFILFAGPPAAAIEWDAAGVQGLGRWLRRVAVLVHECVAAADIAPSSAATVPTPAAESTRRIRREQHATIASVTADLRDRHAFNTAIASLMRLSNFLRDLPPAAKALPAYGDCVRTLLQLLAPMAPHFASEMWTCLPQHRDAGGVLEQRWPMVDPRALAAEDAPVVVQVNGRTRELVHVPTELLRDADALVRHLWRVPSVAARLTPDGAARVVVAHNGRLVNFVVGRTAR